MTSDPFSQFTRAPETVEGVLRAERHRAKNTLQVIVSLLSLQAREVADASARNLLVTAQERVRVIALLYERLPRGGTSGAIDFSAVCNDLVAASLRSLPQGIAIASQVNTDPLTLNLDTAIPLGLITHELLSDALQHAFVDRPSGRIEVSLRSTSSLECTLTVSDDGVTRTPLSPSAGEGLRAKIVDVLVRQLRARLTLESISGTRLAVRFAVPPLP